MTSYSPPPPDAVEVEVVGAQFQWDMRYPGPDGVFGRVNPELISFETLAWRSIRTIQLLPTTVCSDEPARVASR